MTIVRTLAFGDPEPGAWGVAWIPERGAPTRLALAAGPAASVLEATLEPGDGADGDWRLQSGQSELVVSPLVELLATEPAADEGESVEQLCRVSGWLELDGERQEIDCLGWRAARQIELGDARTESFRQVSAWFESGDAIAVLALRPRKSRGQETDLVVAALREPEITAPLSEPRLSTTYRADGRPARAGVEMWVGHAGPAQAHPDGDRAEEPIEDSERQFPRRAAGEALGPQLDWVVDPFELHAELFRWHSRGLEGPGVYLLGVRR